MSSFVTCPGCSKKITLTEKLRGRKVKCGCGKILKMPGAPATPQPPPASAPVPAQQVTQKPIPITPIPITPINPTPVSGNAPAAPIPVTCGSCFAQFNVNASMAGKSAQCNCGAVINIPAAGAPSSAPGDDPFGMQPADAIGFSADPLGVPSSQASFGQPPPSTNPYWAQGGSQAGKPKKRKIKKSKRPVHEADEGMDGGDMGAIGGIVGGVLCAGLGVVLTLASMTDEGYTIYYGLMITGAVMAIGGIAGLVAGD